MATLTLQQIVQAGLEPTYQAADSGGELIPNSDGRSLLHIKNSGAATRTVTFTSTKVVNGLALADQAVSVPAGEDRIVGPFPQDVFNNGSSQVAVSYDNEADLTIAALKT